MVRKTEHNQAFIDGQNLYYGTTHTKPSWKVDLFRFRQYLKDKYQVEKAYYFLGCLDTTYNDMYTSLQEAGFILVFRKHSDYLSSAKKGNVDTDLVFAVMRNFHEDQTLDKVFIVSGDGDYFRMVQYLINQEKLGKILFPVRKNASSLYRMIKSSYKAYLDDPDVKKKIAYRKQ